MVLFFLVDTLCVRIYNIRMANKNKYHRTLMSFIGIFMVLLACVLTLNMGPVARTLAFPFIYFLGIVSYVFYIFLFAEGLSFVIKGKGLRLPKKHTWMIIFIVLIIFTSLVLVSTGVCQAHNIVLDKSPFDQFNSFFSSISGGWYKKEYIDLFQTNIGGGVLGFSIFALLLPKLGYAAIYAIFISATVLCILICFMPLIIKGVKYLKHREKKTKAVEEPANDDVNEENTFRIEENDVLAQAASAGNDEVAPVLQSNTFEPLNFDKRNDYDAPKSSILETNEKTTTIGGISPAHLDLFGENEIKNVSTILVDESLEATKHQVQTAFDFESEQTTPDVINPENSVEEEIDNETEIETNIDSSIENNIVETENALNNTIDTNPADKSSLTETFVKIEEKIPEPVKKKPIKWIPPSTELLENISTEASDQTNIQASEERKIIIDKGLSDFKIAANVAGYIIGPSITRFLIDYSSTATTSSVEKITLDLSRRLSGVPVRFQATVPGVSYSGLEVPNIVTSTVSFKEVFEALPSKQSHPTAIAFGKDISGKVVWADYDEFPHMLVSGTTRSGKSVFVNSIITTLLMRLSPDEMKLVLVDPKRVEMNRYKEEPHLLCPVINDFEEAYHMLNRMVKLMNDRYQDLEKAGGATNLKEYNEYAKEHDMPLMSYIFIIIDEYADLIQNCKDIGVPLVNLAGKARAAGIHLLVCTQRPSAEIITGTIKSNLACRVSLMASSIVDSKVILDEGGAESLMGNGDMLVKFATISRTGPARLQGCYIKSKEMSYIISYLKEHYELNYDPDFLNLNEPLQCEMSSKEVASGSANIAQDATDDEKYEAVKYWLGSQEYVSMSRIQRECAMGFNRAGKIMLRLQEEGIVSKIPEGNKGFKVLNPESRFNESDNIPTSSELIK